jgi:hypothetical protein
MDTPPFHLLLAGMTLFLLSCLREEIVDIDLGQNDSYLVVQCFLCPQADTTYVLVSRTIPYGSWDTVSFGVFDAVVEIKDGMGHTLSVPLRPGNFPIYTFPNSLLPLTPGGSYHLSVTAPGYPAITSSTVIPEYKAEWETLDSAGSYWQNLEGEWDDKFQKLIVTGTWTRPTTNYGYRVGQEGVHADSVLYGSGTESLSGSETVTSNSVRYFYSDAKASIGRQNGSTIVLYSGYLPCILMTCNQELDNYLKIMESSLEDVSAGDLLEATIQGSVHPVYYSNIQGGFGIFGAYQYSYRFIHVRH